MSSSVRRRRSWITNWWPVALMIAVIALESTEWFGSDNTSGPLRRLYQAIFGQVTDSRWEVIHHYARKSGHFIGYGLMGLSWLRAWWRSHQDWSLITDGALALMCTAVIAGADEFHQSFLPNRTSSPWDVLLDCAGAFALLTIAFIFMRPRDPRELARAA
jgi:VanZ family protein